MRRAATASWKRTGRGGWSVVEDLEFQNASEQGSGVLAGTSAGLICVG